MNADMFSAAFDAMMAERRSNMLAQYDRVLPSGELIYNRFTKARELGFGEGSSIYDTSIVMGKPAVGAHVWIGPYTILEASAAPVSIGDFVSLAAGVSVYSHDSTRYYVSGGKVPVGHGAVTIGSYTALCTMCTVSCGITIGSHCVIAAHSFVNRDVPDFTIVAGTPARAIGKVVLTDDGVRFDYFNL